MKLTDSDKHYLTEYYLRKGYIVVWRGTTNPVMQLSKRGSNVTCNKTWAGDVRGFIESTDKFLNDINK